MNNERLILISSCTAATIVAVVGIYALKKYRYYRKYKHIPGPPCESIAAFLFGESRPYDTVSRGEKCTVEVFTEWANKYGSVCKASFYGNYMVLVNDPDGLKTILIEKDFPKFEPVTDLLSKPFGNRLLGKGLVTQTDNEQWRSQRSLFNASFHRNKLISYMDEFNTQGDLLMEKLRTLADGKTYISLFDQLNRATLDVIANIAFGLNVDSLNDPENKLNDYISHSLESITRASNEPFLAYSSKGRALVEDYKKSIENLRAFARENIQKKIKEIESDGITKKDIFTTMLTELKTTDLDMEELIDHFITFFVAGQETTSNAIAFSLMELGLNPEALKKLKDEVDQVVGARSEITFEDINKLEYTGCVFKEAMRKWPPGHSFSRMSTEDITINGIHIPKGTWLECSTYVSGRQDRFFPNPEAFEPERFLKGSKIAEQNKFSVGPRNCIGQSFAQIEAKVLLAKFIQNFELELDPHQSFRPTEALTMKPKDGCRARLSLRN